MDKSPQKRLSRILTLAFIIGLLFTAQGRTDGGPASPAKQLAQQQAPQQGQQQAPPAPQRAPQPAQQPPQPALPPQPVRSAAAGLVTLNFDDADIYSVVQTIFGEVLKVNYIVDPRVKGRVTFRAVAPVPKDKVLPLMEVILRLNGVGIVEESGLYRIIPISDLPKEPSPVKFGRRPESVSVSGKAVLQVVPVEYITSSDLIRMLTPFLSANAVVVDVPQANQIIIADTDANVKRLLELVGIFDNEKMKQKKPDVFVYPVQNGKAKEIAALLQQIFLSGKAESGARTTIPMPASTPSSSPPPAAGMGGTSYSTSTTPSPSTQQPQITPGQPGKDWIVSDVTKIFPDEVTNTIIVLATPEDYAIIKSTIDRIDIAPRQVVVEGILAQVTLTDNLSLGMSYVFKALDTSIGLNTSSLNTGSTTAAGFSLVGIDNSGSVRAFITALATQSKAKVLAAPHVLVADNREARIQVGQSVPLISSETYAAIGVTPQRTYQYRDIGIILKVKPRVNEGGLVAIDLTQEISTFSTIPVGAAGEQQIALNKTEATTNLVVQDGQTIVIGGLIREDTTKGRTGVPFLSRIPIIGWLFGNTQDDKARVELIILLTPRVVKNQVEAKDITTDFVDKMTESSEGRIKKEELIKEKAKKTAPDQTKKKKE